MQKAKYEFDKDGHTVVTTGMKPRRCKMCGDALTGDEWEVCSSCYTLEVTAGDVW